MRSDEHRPPPLQFRLRSLLVGAVVIGLLFGALRWLEVPPRASLILLVILTVSGAAAVGLLVAIAGSQPPDRDDR